MSVTHPSTPPAGPTKSPGPGAASTGERDVEMRDASSGTPAHSPSTRSPLLPQAVGGPPQLVTIAELDARVEQARRVLACRPEINGHATFLDSFNGKPVTISLHANQRRFRQARLIKATKGMLNREARVRTLNERLRRKRLDEAEMAAALETLRRERVEIEADLGKAVAQHAELVRTAGTLRLAILVDGKHVEQLERKERARSQERQQMLLLDQEYRAKRRRLSTGSARAANK